MPAPTRAAGRTRGGFDVLDGRCDRHVRIPDRTVRSLSPNLGQGKAHPSLCRKRHVSRLHRAGDGKHLGDARTLKDFEEDDLRFAIGCFKRGDVREADAVLTKIAERNPNHPNVMHGLAVVRAMAGDIKYAHAFAQRSVSLGETSQRQITLANVLLARGKIEKGIAVYSMAIRRDPVSAVGHFNVGNARIIISGDYANARSSYLAALDREPHYFKALYNISLVLDKIGNVGEAKEWMKRAIDIRPNDIRAVYALGSRSCTSNSAIGKSQSITSTTR